MSNVHKKGNYNNSIIRNIFLKIIFTKAGKMEGRLISQDDMT